MKQVVYLISLIFYCGIALASTSTTEDQQKAILYYINQYRVKYHLSPLKMNNKISSVAVVHSQRMADKNISFGHKGFYDRFKQLTKVIPNSKGAAENVAYYKIDPKILVDKWFASRGHRRNILGNYNLTGIGIAYCNKPGWAYFTQIFVKQST